MNAIEMALQEANDYRTALEGVAKLQAEIALVRAQNPLTLLLENASGILAALDDATGSVELAIEAEVTARRAAKEAVQVYEDLEAEWTYEAMAAPIPEGGAKITVDVRKAQIAAQLVKARQGNGLSRPYAAKQQAEYKAEDAKMALAQAEKRFSATRSAADLVAAMLNAAK